MRFLSFFALTAPLVAAIEFTTPAANSTLTKGQTYELTWSSVDTDPEDFSIYLVNFVNWPPFYVPLAYGVETAAGAYKVRVPCDVDSSYGFQFNAINGTNVYVIYSQTPKFYISGGPCTDPTAPSTCAPAATVTVTVSTTLSSSMHHSNSSYTPSGTSVTKPTHLAVTTVVKKVTVATCPNTIGWGTSGYSHPVTLTSAPHPPGVTPTAAPTMADEKSVYASTSTIYQTVYRDLSEGCGAC